MNFGSNRGAAIRSYSTLADKTSTLLAILMSGQYTTAELIKKTKLSPRFVRAMIPVLHDRGIIWICARTETGSAQRSFPRYAICTAPFTPEDVPATTKRSYTFPKKQATKFRFIKLLRLRESFDSSKSDRDVAAIFGCTATSITVARYYRATWPADYAEAVKQLKAAEGF